MIARTVANNQHSAGRNSISESVEEARLFVRAKIMQEIEEDDVAGLYDRIADIMLDELKVLISSLRHRVGPLDLSAIGIESANRRQKIALAQIEGQ